jgi:hypothetical protein
VDLTEEQEKELGLTACTICEMVFVTTQIDANMQAEHGGGTQRTLARLREATQVDILIHHLRKKQRTQINREETATGKLETTNIGLTTFIPAACDQFVL